MAMKNSFAELGSNMFSRKFGGTTVGTADPYLTGYHFIWFDYLPPNLPGFIQQTGGNAGDLSEDDIKSILAATCMSVTPPGGTLNKVEFTGLGGVKWAVPGNIDYGNSVTIKFFELKRTPVFDIIHSWFKMIRDYRTGATDLVDGDSVDNYTKKQYAATMFYWTTTPDGNNIEYFAAYDGMFPNKDPQDLFTSDVESVGKLDIEIEFNVDTVWHQAWVKSRIQGLMSKITDTKSLIQSREF